MVDTNEIPATTNIRTRRIGSALCLAEITPWRGGRTRGEVTMHWAWVRATDGRDPVAAVTDAVSTLGWSGVTVEVEERNVQNFSELGYPVGTVVAIRVPRG